MGGICVYVVNPVQFFQFLKDVAMATNFVEKLWQNYLPYPALITLSFRNRIGYRYLNARVNSVNDASISCENFMKFGPVTPELTSLFVNVRYNMAKKLAHLVEYLRIYWTDFGNLSTI